ncbi:MFS transporter, partial [Burkholderia sp. SIMBA_013]
RRFDFGGFILLAAGMATLTLALDGQRSSGGSPLLLGAMILIGMFSLLFYLMHARSNDNALFSLKLFDNRIYSIGLLGSFTGRIGSGMLTFMP